MLLLPLSGCPQEPWFSKPSQGDSLSTCKSPAGLEQTMAPLTLDSLSMSLCPRLMSGLHPPETPPLIQPWRPRPAELGGPHRGSSINVQPSLQPHSSLYLCAAPSLPVCVQAVGASGTRWGRSLDIWNDAPCLSRTSFFSPVNLTFVRCFRVYKVLIQPASHPILPPHHRRMRSFITLFSQMSILIPRRSSDLPKASWLVKGRARTHSEAPWPQILSRHHSCSTRCLNVPTAQRGEGLWPHFTDVGNYISERVMTLGEVLRAQLGAT